MCGGIKFLQGFKKTTCEGLLSFFILELFFSVSFQQPSSFNSLVNMDQLRTEFTATIDALT